MNLRCTFLLSIPAFLLAAAPAAAQSWTDDMEAHNLGMLELQGDWVGWDNNTTAFTNVVDASVGVAPHGGAQLVEVASGADTVADLTSHDLSGGAWVLTSWVYLPSSFIGKTYFIVLNEYNAFGPYEWATDIAFNGDSGLVECDCGSAIPSTTPLVLDQWVQIRCDIDLEADNIKVYYDATGANVLIGDWAWSDGPFGDGSFGPQPPFKIDALDLYPDTPGFPHVTPAYYDDIVIQAVDGVVGTPYCSGDGSGSACPCGNDGGAGEGCANSSGAGGILGGTGSDSAAADDLVFDAANLLPAQPGLLFVGQAALNGGNGVAFGDGLRCAGASVVRLGVMTPGAGGTASWGPGLGATGGWGAGDTRYFQCWYRDPAGSPCGFGFNLSNGVQVDFTN